MTTKKSLFVMTLALAAASGHRLTAQVQTEVPPVVPGAKPVAVERIKIHGAALENNLVRLPAGRAFDVLGWVASAHQQAGATEATLVAAVTRARQGGATWSGIDRKST